MCKALLGYFLLEKNLLTGISRSEHINLFKVLGAWCQVQLQEKPRWKLLFLARALSICAWPRLGTGLLSFANCSSALRFSLTTLLAGGCSFLLLTLTLAVAAPMTPPLLSSSFRPQQLDLWGLIMLYCGGLSAH